MAVKPPEPKITFPVAAPTRLRRYIRAINPFLSASDTADLAKSRPLSNDPNFKKEYSALPVQAGYRQTQPININPFAFGTLGEGALGVFFLPKKEPQKIAVEDIWSGAWTPGGLINVLIDISPDVSKALWNNLRLTGTKALFKATKLKGEDDEAGQELIEDALSKINPDNGGVDNWVTTAALSLYVFGALATDSSFNFNLDGTDDCYVVHPDTIWFQRDEFQKPIPFQMQYMWGYPVTAMQDPSLAQHNPAFGSALPFKRLNQALFKYTAFDPTVDDPYGRGPFWPVLQVIFFLAQLLRDLQRVVENQAWGRTDLSMDSEKLMAIMERIAPQQLNSPEAYSDFIAQRLAEIAGTYNGLSPQEAYTHLDLVTVNQNVKGAQTGFDVSSIVDIVRQQIITAVKQLPIFMDFSQATGADSATQFEIFFHSIERVRDIISDHMIRHLQLNAWSQGHQGKIFAKWPEIRSTQRLQDAQAESVEVQTSATMRDNGWITQDQAAIRQTGTKAVKQTPDWDHLMPAKKRGPGTQGGEIGGTSSSSGSVPKGEDKNTGSNTVKGSTASKNKR